MVTGTYNLGTERRPFLVEFSVNPFFDLLMSTWSSLGGEEKAGAYEVGAEWFDEFRTRMPDGTVERLREMSGGLDHTFVLWRTAGLIADRATGIETIDDSLDWLRDQPFRAALASELCWSAASADLEAALDRDPDAIDRVLEAVSKRGDKTEEEWELRSAEMRGFLSDGVDDLGLRLADLLGEIRDNAFRHIEEAWSAGMRRSAAAVEMMVPGSEAQDLIERVTQGIDYQIPLGTTRLVLVPSVIIRPWSMVEEIGSSVVIAYPVDEEHLSVDPDAAPGWLVSFYKALGDGKRLKILRRLATGPADLTELTELLGMAKSSTFHHIGVLRSAGLVKVHLGGTNSGTYELRTRAFRDAEGLLDKYIDQPLIDTEEST